MQGANTTDVGNHPNGWFDASMRHHNEEKEDKSQAFEKTFVEPTKAFDKTFVEPKQEPAKSAAISPGMKMETKVEAA